MLSNSPVQTLFVVIISRATLNFWCWEEDNPTIQDPLNVGSVDFQNMTWNHATETERHRPLHALEGGGQDHARHGGGEGEGEE